MPGRRFQIYSREFKEAAVRRILAGEKIRPVAAELRVRPQCVEAPPVPDALGCSARRSRSVERDGEELRACFTVLNAFRYDAEGKRLDPGESRIFTLAIGQDAW